MKQTIVNYLQENIEDIIKYRESGIKCAELAIMYHTSPSSITRALESNGVYTRNLLPMTSDNIHMLINEYVNGRSMGEIAKTHGVSRSTISRLLTENNVKIRPAYKTTYNVNEHFFDDINTPEKAYVLGMWTADGNVHNNTLKLDLQEGDKHILEDINNLFESDRPLRYLEQDVGKNKWSLCVTNKYMAEQLKNKGVVENKSLIMEYPQCITDDLLPHFLRGLLDGDGSIGSTRYFVGYYGTKMLLFEIADRIERILGIHFYPHEERCHNGITYNIGIYKQDHCIQFLNYIYNNSTIHLNRKFALYQKYINKSLLTKKAS